MRYSDWNYYNPVFESDLLNPAMIVYSPWSGHRRFIYDLTRFLEPDMIVELGSYYGCSAFTFLQAIKDGNLGTSFYAVDTWEGDSYTANDYREDIFGAYKETQDTCFSNQNSFMLRMTFDEASDQFAKQSISILHIDGSHSYEDVKHDFKTWEEKVKQDGIVVFHDTGKDLLYGNVMGSHIFWEELKARRSYTLEFPFSNGLGLLFMSREIYDRVSGRFDPAVYMEYLFLQDTVNKDIIRKDYFEVLNLKKEIKRIGAEKDSLDAFAESKEKYIDDLTGQIDKLKKYAEEKDSYNCQLSKDLKEEKAFADEKEQYCRELEKNLDDINNFLLGKEEYIKELESKLSALNDFVKKKESYINSLKKESGELKAYADGKAAYCQELEKELVDLKAYADGKTGYSEELEKQLKELKEYADGKTEYSEELEKQLEELKEYADGKTGYSEELEKQLKELKEYADGKADYSSELENQLKELKEYADGKADYSSELEKQLKELKEYADGKADYSNELENQLKELKEYADGKADYSSELEKQLEELKEYADGKTKYCLELQKTVDEQVKKTNEIKAEADHYHRQVSDIYRFIAELPFGQKILKNFEKKSEMMREHSE